MVAGLRVVVARELYADAVRTSRNRWRGRLVTCESWMATGRDMGQPRQAPLDMRFAGRERESGGGQVRLGVG